MASIVQCTTRILNNNNSSTDHIIPIGFELVVTPIMNNGILTYNTSLKPTVSTDKPTVSTDKPAASAGKPAVPAGKPAGYHKIVNRFDFNPFNPNNKHKYSQSHIRTLDKFDDASLEKDIDELIEKSISKPIHKCDCNENLSAYSMYDSAFNEIDDVELKQKITTFGRHANKFF